MRKYLLWRYQRGFPDAIEWWRRLLKIYLSWEVKAKEKAFMNLFPQDEHKLKRVIGKQPLLTSDQIFEKSGTEEV